MHTFHTLTLSDLPILLTIEQESQAHPWTSKMLKDCLEKEYYNVGLIKNNQLLGYAILSLFPPQAEILTICITKSSQGQGYGKALLQHLITTAQQANITELLLEVRASNTPAITLYQQQGFVQTGIRKNYYRAHDNGQEDAWLFTKNISRQ